MAQGNLAKQGEYLEGVHKLCRELGVLLVLVHHFKKSAGQGSGYLPPQLDELSGAGFAEFAGQWLLLSRRSSYEFDGKHEMWLIHGVRGQPLESGRKALEIFETCQGLLARNVDWRVQFVDWERAMAEQAAGKQARKRAATAVTQQLQIQRLMQARTVVGNRSHGLTQTKSRQSSAARKLRQGTLAALVEMGVLGAKVTTPGVYGNQRYHAWVSSQ